MSSTEDESAGSWSSLDTPLLLDVMRDVCHDNVPYVVEDEVPWWEEARESAVARLHRCEILRPARTAGPGGETFSWWALARRPPTDEWSWQSHMKRSPLSSPFLFNSQVSSPNTQDELAGVAERSTALHHLAAVIFSL